MLRRNYPALVLFYAVTVVLYAFAAPILVSAQTDDRELIEDSCPSSTTPRLVYQTVWAGYILYAPYSIPKSGRAQIPKKRFKSIEGEWIVPSAVPAINCALKG